MERALFDWSGWDGEPDAMCFYNAVLKVQIGGFPPGTKFSSAWVFQKPAEGKGELHLYKEGDSEAIIFALSYVVGKQFPPKRIGILTIIWRIIVTALGFSTLGISQNVLRCTSCKR